MPRYAARTTVSVMQSKADIESILARYGAEKFGLTTDVGRAIVMFQAHNRTVRFVLPLPNGQGDKIEQEQRTRWRALLLTVKGKLESVASRIETFDEAFLAHVVMKDGETAYEKIKPMMLPPPNEDEDEDK